MSEIVGSWIWLHDQRLAPLAVSAVPAWLWSLDGTAVLWTNAAGAASLGASTAAAVTARALDPGDPNIARLVRLAASLQPDGTPRAEQLRGLAAGVDTLACICSHITLADGRGAILIAATEPAVADLSLEQRVHRLLADCREPLAAFASDGTLLCATAAAQARLAGATSLAALGGETLAAAARQTGDAAGAGAAGALDLACVGTPPQTVLIATLAAPARHAERDPPHDQQHVGQHAAPLVPHPAAPDAGAATMPTVPSNTVKVAPARRVRPLRFVWQMDAQSRFTVGSGEFAALMGEATAAVLGRPWPEIAAALALDLNGQVAQALASHGTWSGLSVAWPVGDGSERLVVELSGLPVFDRERAFLGFRGFGICRDPAGLTATVQARPAVLTLGAPAAVRDRLQDAVQDAAVPFIADASENVVRLHPGSETAVPALSPGEHSAFHELRRRLTERLMSSGRAEDQGPLQGPLQGHSQDHAANAGASPRIGAPIRLKAIDPALAHPVRTAEPPLPERARAGSPTDAEAVLARAQAESRELKAILGAATEARRQAERASAAKSDFLAKISHEIRNPLNAIIGFSEVMAQEKFGPVGSERYRQYLADIHASGQHILSLVNDLLDLSKIEAGKLELDFADVALNPVTEQCVAIMQPQANRERVIIRTSLAPKLPPVMADARSVRQIVLNLISNSTKFTGAGGQVIVSTTLTDRGDVALRVRDTGLGMSEQEIAIALEPFRQVATTARAGGTGLGLPLTKALAEANRAAFSIKSAPNAGTLVEVTFRPSPRFPA
jgi:signal transduction histidine kinase